MRYLLLAAAIATTGASSCGPVTGNNIIDVGAYTENIGCSWGIAGQCWCVGYAPPDNRPYGIQLGDDAWCEEEPAVTDPIDTTQYP